MRAFLRSFRYAAKGIANAVKRERNMRFHLCVAVYVLFFSLYYPFGVAEYAILFLCIGGVLALELVNSAIEQIMDKLHPQPSTRVGLAKDMAAGAVLVFSIAAALCGSTLFLNGEVLSAILGHIGSYPWLVLPLAASLAGSYWFVFVFNRKKD